MDVFGHLVRSSLDIVIHAWPISLLLVLAALVALFVGHPFREPQFHSRVRAILLTYLFPVAVLSVGALLRYDWKANPKWVEPPDWYGGVLWGVVAIHVAVLLAIVIGSKSGRLRSAAVLLPGLWLTLSCGFMAAIAIVGVGP
jgi:predicted permease